MKTIFILPPLMASLIVIMIFSVNPEVAKTEKNITTIEDVRAVVETPAFSMMFFMFNESKMGLWIDEDAFILEISGTSVIVKEGTSQTLNNLSISRQDFQDIKFLVDQNNLRDAAVLFIEKSKFEPSYVKFEIMKNLI